MTPASLMPLTAVEPAAASAKGASMALKLRLPALAGVSAAAALKRAASAVVRNRWGMSSFTLSFCCVARDHALLWQDLGKVRATRESQGIVAFPGACQKMT